MEKIKQMALSRQIEVLTNLGVKFCIIDSDGNKHGNLEAVEPQTKKPRSPLTRPKGAVISYLRPFIENLKPGETVSIPAGEFGLKTVQSSTCSYLCTKHGPNRAITTQVAERNEVDVVLV